MRRLNLTLILLIVTVMTFSSVFPSLAANASPALPERHSNVQPPSRSGLTRINFARGATSAVVSGSLAANSRVEYVLRALSGQLMDVTLSAPEGVKLSVTTSQGRLLVPQTSSSTSFRGYLPRTSDYILTVSSSSTSISYSVSVSIPERISFQRGTTSATIKGSLEASQNHDYILRAQKGQLMEIKVSPENSLQLIIFGVDGTVLRSGMGAGSTFRGELPLSEDYIVTVRAAGQAVTYTMDVIIPQRISFQRGSDSALLRGRLAASGRHEYILRALKDQTMQVEITPISGMQLIIYGADGTILTSNPPAGSSFTGKLPSTQDYIVVLKSVAASAVLYQLRVIIR